MEDALAYGLGLGDAYGFVGRLCVYAEDRGQLSLIQRGSEAGPPRQTWLC
jgi:hypothetical protein